MPVSNFAARAVRCAVLGAAVATASVFATPAAALTQSWNGYHWARTGPLAIKLGDNVAAAWKPYLQTAATDWTAANNIDFVQVAGRSTPATCGAVYGGVQACSGNYGATGWLGYATVWTSNGFVVQATVKLNDYYFSQPYYNTAAWRSMVTCQEVGHTLGLAHTNEVRTDLNTGSCMDYTNDPSGLLGSNGTLANLHPNSVDFGALDGIYAKLDATQLSYTKPQFVTGHGYSIDGSETDESPVAFVPEPSSWALLLAGFGVAGGMQRRRRGLPVAA